MQSQCLKESGVEFTHLIIFRLSDTNIYHRQIDGINRKFILNNFYQNPVLNSLVHNSSKYSLTYASCLETHKHITHVVFVYVHPY